jgi:two-component sensor histidine kinase
VRFRHHLALFALVSTLPLLVLSIMLAVSNANAQRDLLERASTDTVRALQLGIDQELRAALTALQTLATSPSVDAALASKADPRRAQPFLDQAHDLIARRPAAIQALVLYDLTGRQLANSQRPAGAAIPRLSDLRAPAGPPSSAARYLQDAVEARKAQVTPLFYSPIARRWVVGFVAPVIRGERVVGMIAGNILPAALGTVMRRQPIPAGFYATLVDDRGIVVARTRDEDRYIGRRPPILAPERDGLVPTAAFGGEPVYATTRRLDAAPWRVAFLAPREAVDGVMRGMLFPLAVGGALLVAIAIAGGLGLGRRLGREIELLADPAAPAGRRGGMCIEEVDAARVRLAAAGAADRARLDERQDALEHQQLLVAELSHRVKNVLSVVQSIAIQTMSGSRDMPSFARAFEGRLQALAAAHGQVLASGWRTVAIEELVRTALAPASAAGDRVSIGGDAIALGPKQSVALALVLHELMTNAAKYGALSTESGHLDVSWRTRADQPVPTVELVWSETGLAGAPGQTRSGFGTRLIERLMRTDLGGHHLRETGSTSLVWAFDFVVAGPRRTPGSRGGTDA